MSISGLTLGACCVLETKRCGLDASVIGMGCIGFELVPGLKVEGFVELYCDGTPVRD